MAGFFLVVGAHANEIVDWNNELLTITQQTSGNLVSGPPEVARDIALLGNAMSDAVNAATGSTLPSFAYTGGPMANASATVAAATAAYTALTSIFDNAAWQTPISTVTGSSTPNASNVTLANNIVLPELRTFLMQQLNNLGLLNPSSCTSSTSTLCNGYNLGIDAADAVIAKRANDGAVAAIQNGLLNNQPPGSGVTPGVYVPPTTRPEMFPAWGASVAPIGVTPAQIVTAQSTVSGPPPLDSTAYASALLQTECEGSSAPLNTLPANVQSACAAAGFKQQTTQQATAALFWNDPGTTIQPPGHWLQIADTVMLSQSSSLLQSARLSALLGNAETDAGIASWGIKYEDNLWRPVTGIRDCGSSGNGVTWNNPSCDPAWSSLIATPPHPDYVAGHPAFSGAAATVLADFFGTDDISFSSTSNYYCNGGKATFGVNALLVSCTLNNVVYLVSNSADCADIVDGININGSPLICPITETFDSFTDASSGPNGAEFSRVVGGIHTPFAVEDALTVGDAIGEAVAENAGLPEVVLEPAGIGILMLPLLGLGYVRRATFSEKTPSSGSSQ
jgi:hypothetical protein